MPQLTVTKSYDAGQTLTEAMLDDIKNSLETFFNTTKIDTDNIAASGVATANIADSAVTAAKLAADAVTTTKILDANVTTAKLADTSVTPAKMGTLGQQLSSSSGAFSTTSGSYEDVTNLSITITTYGRPVFLCLVHDGSASTGTVRATAAVGSTDSLGYFKFLRGATLVSEVSILVQPGPASSALGVITAVPPGAISAIDPVAAGTYTYKLQAKKANQSAQVLYCKLMAFEV